MAGGGRVEGMDGGLDSILLLTADPLKRSLLFSPKNDGKKKPERHNLFQSPKMDLCYFHIIVDIAAKEVYFFDVSIP